MNDDRLEFMLAVLLAAFTGALIGWLICRTPS